MDGELFAGVRSRRNPPDAKSRKGDFAVVRVPHSASYLVGGRRETHDTYEAGVVASADRAGRVKTVMLGVSRAPVKIEGAISEVRVLPASQIPGGDARALIAELMHGAGLSAEWESLHEAQSDVRTALLRLARMSGGGGRGYNVTANPARRRAARRNPPLAVVNPPRVEVVGVLGRPHSICYTHASDGKHYEHKFGSTARIVLLSDGTVRIESTKGKPMWGDF